MRPPIPVEGLTFRAMQSPTTGPNVRLLRLSLSVVGAWRMLDQGPQKRRHDWERKALASPVRGNGAASRTPSDLIYLFCNREEETGTTRRL